VKVIQKDMLVLFDPLEAQYERGCLLSTAVFMELSSHHPVPPNLSCFITKLKAFFPLYAFCCSILCGQLGEQSQRTLGLQLLSP